MKNQEIYSKWTLFIEEYVEYFKSNKETWTDTFEQLSKYIIKNKKRPSSTDKNIKIKMLGYWVNHQ